MSTVLDFPLPASLNGNQLEAELAAAGVVTPTVTVSMDDCLLVTAVEPDRETVELVISQHVPAAPPAHIANRATLEERAATALAANATFLAIATPTNAQTLAQVKTLTKECTALIRLALNLLDSTDGT